jgi:uncharacterized membrane protein
MTPVTNIADATSDEALAEAIVRAAYEQERRRRRKPLPRWLAPAMRVLPRLLLIVTLANGLIGLLALLAAPLRAALGDAATAPLYTLYSALCPQRASHTWFVAGEPMAMEQRMVAMYLAFGLAGAAWLVWSRVRLPFPTWAVILGITPALIDVALSTWGIRPSTPVSRLWTGALAALAIVWWAYPRFETQLRAAQERVALLRARRSPAGD